MAFSSFCRKSPVRSRSYNLDLSFCARSSPGTMITTGSGDASSDRWGKGWVTVTHGIAWPSSQYLNELEPGCREAPSQLQIHTVNVGHSYFYLLSPGILATSRYHGPLVTTTSFVNNLLPHILHLDTPCESFPSLRAPVNILRDSWRARGGP